jgi:F-type H+-transporting ATPase subunit gamma
MPSLRNMRLRMRSVKNISQVTKALEAVSASKVRRAQQTVTNTRAYAGKAYQVLQHLGTQPGTAASLHPLLAKRAGVKNITVVLITSDRGLCGAYNTNMLRAAMAFVRRHGDVPVKFIAVGKKGRDLLLRRKQSLIGEFVNLPGNPTFNDVSAIGRMAVEEFLSGRADEVYLAYTDYINTLRQEPRLKLLLPLRSVEAQESVGGRTLTAGGGPAAAYIYEPSQTDLLDVIVPRFTGLQVFQAVLEAMASEHSARMVAMRNATDSAKELLGTLQLVYNKARQLSITSDLLDIVGGVEALAKARR